jgi:hypothetical protein
MPIKRKTLLLLLSFALLITVSVAAFSQYHFAAMLTLPAKAVWEKNYGGTADDRALDAIAANNGYLVVGSTRSVRVNTTEGWLLFIDQNGNSVWNRTLLLGNNTEFRYALALNGGFLVVGNEFLDNGDTRGFAVETDSNGNVLRNWIIGNQSNKLFSAIRSGDSVFLLGSTFDFTDNSNSSPFIAKIDLKGTIFWEKSYPEKTSGCFRSGVFAENGNFLAAGYYKDPTSNLYRFLVMKFDSEGNVLWSATDANDKNQKAYAIARVSDGYTIVGEAESQTSDLEGVIMKIDLTGRILWDKTIGGSKADSFSAITPLEDDSCLVTGFTFSYGAGNRDIWFIKISNQGKVLWSCTQGNSGYQEAYAILQTPSDKYLLVGWTDPPGEPNLVGKAKYDVYIAELYP